MKFPAKPLPSFNSKTVYFIKPIGMEGPVKIGCSVSPDLRRRALACWSPFPLEIVAQIHGSLYVERQFHAMFLASHSHQEWFHITPELSATIAAIQAGGFDLAGLPKPSQLPDRKKPGPYRKRQNASSLAALSPSAGKVEAPRLAQRGPGNACKGKETQLQHGGMFTS